MFFFFPAPEIWKTGLTCLIGLATLIGIMTRPFRWNEAIIAMVGAAVLLLLGLIAPADAFLTLIRDWNTFLFFLGMMGLSALAEAAGLFDWLAVQAARLAGQAEEAIDLLDPLPAEAPGPGLAAIAIRALARALELDGRRKDALEQIAKVLDLEDAPSEDFVFAADVRSMQGDFAAARDALDRALRVDPDELAVIYASVRYWLRAKRPDEAVGDVEHALRRRPVNPYLHVLLGFVDTAAGRGPGLDEQIERAAEFGLDASEAWSWASSLSEDQGDLRSAANALDKALKLSPKDPGLLARQGAILLALGQYDDAVHVLRRCIRRTKSDVDSFRRLAEALTASGRPEKALTGAIQPPCGWDDPKADEAEDFRVVAGTRG